MIALILFENPLIVSKEEADKLGLKYEQNPAFRYGIQNDRLHRLADYEYYEDELTSDKLNSKGESISAYYIYKRVDGDFVYIEQNGHLVKLEEFVNVCKYKFFVERAVNEAVTSPTFIQGILKQVEDKLNEVNKLLSSNTFNQKCNVHVGGGLIVTYNEVMLKENTCTDEIQKELDVGWRVIAVCSQPDQRRPDYILGRFNPNKDNLGESAAR